ncbi:glycosyltransferase [aff. Roholtiella sp. LEGE 12411]|uniref:glycosyltransferase n=1 Tax=aff. Roholtiella sp. LEGE 12411 TaxID=1828822 RepID=UPI001881CADD|nr:glycosyltransferase [aff. Roholtiella sp. LEGE 12411]MBE9033803.1 glycosyltransferase [aff. Roholtiella sp. LEGE 12411]
MSVEEPIATKNRINSVSILMPTHNRDWLLKKSLDSLTRIDVPSHITLELIVTANACTDSTLSLLADYQNKFPYILKYFHEIEPGANLARNRCLQEAEGEIIAMVDDDIQFDKGWLLGIVEAFENFSVDIVGGRVLLLWEAIEPPHWLNHQLEILLSAYDLGNELVSIDLPGPLTANLAFRRYVYEKLGLMHTSVQNKKIKIHRGDEIEYLIQAKKADFKAIYVPKALGYHWMHPNRINSDFFKFAGLGFGKSRAYVKEKLTIFNTSRSLIGFSYLSLRYAFAMMLAKQGKNESAYLYNLYLCMVGVGGLQGTFDRLFNSTTS